MDGSPGDWQLTVDLGETAGLLRRSRWAGAGVYAAFCGIGAGLGEIFIVRQREPFRPLVYVVLSFLIRMLFPFRAPILVTRREGHELKIDNEYLALSSIEACTQRRQRGFRARYSVWLSCRDEPEVRVLKGLSREQAAFCVAFLRRQLSGFGARPGQA